MVSYDLRTYIQQKIDYIIANYEETINGTVTKIFAGYTCKISGDINYEFLSPSDKQIEASLFIGSATKNNDLENKYNQKFTINIASEINGGKMAMKLFTLLFEGYTRKYIDLGDYKAKIFLTSPVFMGKYENINSNYINYMVMNGDIEYVKDVVLGCKYSISLNGTNYTEVLPRTPYVLKEAMGGVDIQVLNATQNGNTAGTIFSKSSDVMTINLVVIYELNGDTNDTTHDTIFNSLLNECYGASNQKYYFKTEIGGTGGTTKTISNLICVRGQHIYDEATGENVLSLQFKVGA